MNAAKKVGGRLEQLLLSVKVGVFLALRQVRRGSIWTNLLIIAIMMFTFLNLVVVSGILVGLIEGIGQSVKTYYTGDIIVTNLKSHTYIERSQNVIDTIKKNENVTALSARYLESGTVQEDYKQLTKASEERRIVGAIFAGIDPVEEDQFSGLSKLVVEGQYLDENDYDEVLIGGQLLFKYAGFESEAFPVLTHTEVGSKILITVNGASREVTVKGVVRSKVDEIDRRVFFTDKQLRQLIGRYDYNVDEISVRILPDADPNLVKQELIDTGMDTYAKVQTNKDAEPKFVQDIRQTFAILGNAISSIGLAVAAITIFIVIFINAITRRKYIGILKGVGVEGVAIESAYIFQALFYAAVGTILGCILVFGFLKPYFDAHPIDFPFSDGILVATVDGTLLRVGVLFIATLIAGYLPARIVVRQNTLDAILGR